MDYKHNAKLLPFARVLRKQMTKEERHLWYDFLRKGPGRFSRQKILGKYIADFYSAQASIVIEVDGSQHYEPEAQKGDEERTAYLKKFGLRVIRIPNNQINQNFQGVCEYLNSEIESALSKKHTE